MTGHDWKCKRYLVFGADCREAEGAVFDLVGTWDDFEKALLHCVEEDLKWVQILDLATMTVVYEKEGPKEYPTGTYHTREHLARITYG